MENPLDKRLFRDLKQDFGRYLVIFLFLTMLISLVSGFLVTDYSVAKTYDEGITRYNMEDGHLRFTGELSENTLNKISELGYFDLYDLWYVEETPAEKDVNIRIYADRNDNEIDGTDVLSGKLPETSDEIAVDRMFADNNDLEIGDVLTIRGKAFTICGKVAFVDYSCLYENNSDMMFDSIGFGVAEITQEAFDALDGAHINYNYAWKYEYAPKDDATEKEYSEAVLGGILQCIDNEKTSSGEKLEVDDFVPRYNNQAINFTKEDMGSDAAMFKLFMYLVVAVLAFIFAVTTSNSIEKEAMVIGTLRATGYTKGELIEHYLITPMTVSLVAAIIGNVIGYTVIPIAFKKVYYGSYSLATYESYFDVDALIDTTLIPLVIMFVVNLIVLANKMSIRPLNFLRRDLKRHKNRKAVKLSSRIPFMARFRLRIFFQNIPAYFTLFLGIVLGGLVIIFSLMFGPLLDDYAEAITNSKISNYQYVLVNEVETSSQQAEKYCIESLDTTYKNYMTDEVSIYGIEDNSSYISEDIPEGKVLISNGYATKYNINIGDEITLKDHYTDDTYTFTVAGVYDYEAAIAVFMNRSEFNEMFDEEEDHYSGYFSNEELSDIDSDDIATVITEQDLTKVSDQMHKSLGEAMDMFKYFGVIMYLLLMYIMTKQILEKNMQSIAMTKILGFKSREISRLYLVITSIVVVISLIATVPLAYIILKWGFSDYIYTEITGYIPFMVSKSCYIEMVITGIISYVVVCIFMMRKINRIPKSEALKNVE